MKLHSQLLLPMLFVLVFLSKCHTQPASNGAPPRSAAAPSKVAAPKRAAVRTEKEVTFYPTYGYRDEKGWQIHLRGWVHKNRTIRNEGIAKLAAAIFGCGDAERPTVQARTDDFTDDDKTLEKVVVKFDSDSETHASDRSLPKGIVEIDVQLPAEKATHLLQQQQSTNGWLTYEAVSDEHTGIGRVRLIEPDPNGVSLISDIDDTIKVTEVPAGRSRMLRNTFCFGFKTAPEMLTRYRDLGDVPVHYVSGGPEQMFGPLYDFLIVGTEPFPEGTFHLKFFPKADFHTVPNIVRSIISSLQVTHDHKIEQIRAIMNTFPDRKFILAGDSGEIDPEVYNAIRKERPAQVKEIWIRDVLNDNVTNQFRLEGMTVIPVNPPICINDEHFQNLTKMIKQSYPGQTYRKNVAAPCG